MRKVLYFILPIALFWCSCKKDNLKQNVNNTSAQLISGGADVDAMLPYRWISPYSLKTIRALRTAIANHPDEKVQNLLNGTLNPDNYRLYYKIEPETEIQVDAFNNWIEADTNHIVFRYPLDSSSLFPNIFTEEVIAQRNDTSEVFYTTVPLSQPISGMNAIVQDTLYIPGSNEVVLDFILNLITANLSDDYISSIQTDMPELWQITQDFITNELFVIQDPNGGNQPLLNGFTPLDLTNPDIPGYPFIERATREGDYQTDVYPEGPVRPVTIQRGITFTDNNLNSNEPIKRLHVVGHRFGAVLFTAYTGVDGRFTTNTPLMGPLLVSYRFINGELQIRSINRSANGTVVGLFLRQLTNVIRYNIPTEHMVWTLSRNVNDITINFPHGGAEALWGLTFNAIQEANDYTVVTGMRSGGGTRPGRFLDVLCWMTNNGNTSASAPMFKQMTVRQDPSNYVYLAMGLSQIGNAALAGILPDLLIKGNNINPDNSHAIRQTVYHEYGHSLHYFKTNNNFWNINIQYSVVGSGYGNDITSPRGSFFSLSEGWADYIGHLFNSMKYGNFVNFNERNRWTNVIQNGNYQFHLENTPTFFNNFIPRGLFFDLTDGGNNEWYDRIQGFTTNDIYQKFNPTMTSIQLFRQRWESDHPSVDNAILFDEYDVD